MISQAALEAAAGKYELIIVLVPVQHGKTTYGSQYHGAWTLGNWPAKKVLAASYTQKVVEDKIGRPVRAIIERVGRDVFGVTVDRRSSSVSRWDIAGYADSFLATSVNAGIASRRVDLGLIDDPIGSRGDVDTRAKRDDMWAWYREEYLTRLAPGAPTFAIMSPWHPDDLVHRMIRHAIENHMRLRVIDLPAICPGPDDEGPVSEARRIVAIAAGKPEPPKEPYVDELGRKPGEALWPEVRPIKFLESQRLAIGDRQFSGQFQMRPRALAGALFKREHFRYFQLAPRPIGSPAATEYELLAPSGEVVDRVAFTAIVKFAMSDLAAGGGAKSDYFVIGTFGVTPANDLLVLHIERPDPVPQAPEQLEALSMSWKTWRWFRVGIEAVAYQQALVDFAVRRGLPAYPIKRGGGLSKDARIELAAVRVEQGTVYFPKVAVWREKFEDELLAFRPGGGSVNDDQCDVLADATEAVAQRGANTAPAGAYRSPAERR